LCGILGGDELLLGFWKVWAQVGLVKIEGFGFFCCYVFLGLLFNSGQNWVGGKFFTWIYEL
jgi:hypothetical protein